MKKQNLMIVSVFAGVLMLSLVSAGWFSNIFTHQTGNAVTTLRAGGYNNINIDGEIYRLTDLEQVGNESCFDFSSISSHERQNVCLKDDEEKVIGIGGRKVRLKGRRGKKSFGKTPFNLEINLEGSPELSPSNEPVEPRKPNLFQRLFGLNKQPVEEPVTPVADHTMEHSNNGNSIGNLASGENQTGTCTCYDQADFYDQAFFHDEVNFLADEVNVHSGVSFKLNDAVHPGYAFACFDSAGKLFRSDIACNLIGSGNGGTPKATVCANGYTATPTCPDCNCAGGAWQTWKDKYGADYPSMGVMYNSSNGNATNFTCVDSDNGLSYNTKGKACVGSNCVWDSCESGKTLKEVSCSRGAIKTTTHTCSGVCENGICKITEANSALQSA